ncbi:hypothetical protein [Amycolatopsis sp. GM8]|uniref:hypothetical protein n=1 Tax=Amycolatopsis sp. GM8 TaxID=2896530 RepID=UPI001F299DF5|nr:hypothetical protein [Amycolatopsis sp. GM8]
MTGSDEKPLADVLEQHQDPDDEAGEPDLPTEADPADVLDQRLAVPEDDEHDHG